MAAYDLVTIEFKPSRTVLLQATDPATLDWLIATLDDVYPYSIKDKLTVTFPSGERFRYGLTCRDARAVVFFLIKELCQHGWEPVGCSMENTWVTGGFFQKERQMAEE